MAAVADGLITGLKAARTWQTFDQLVYALSIRFSEYGLRLLRSDARRAAAGYLEAGEPGAMAAIEEREWRAYLERLWLTVTPAGGALTEADLKPAEDIPEAVYVRSAERWLNDNAKVHARGIVDTTRKTARQAIENGRQQGKQGQGIAVQIQADIFESAPARSKTIANTEVHSSANHGSLTAAEQVDIGAAKIWIATPDDRVRDAHWKAHQQRVKITEPFIVGGEKLMYPGHWSLGASGWNIYGCRCAMRYIVQRRGR